MISLRPKRNNNDQIVVPKEFPGISTYTSTKVFLCFPAVKMNNTNKKILFKTWRYKPVAPCIIMFCAIFFFIMTSIFLFPYFGFDGKIANIVSAFLLLLFFIPYLQTIIIGPGFFPFYWFERKKQRIQANYQSSNNSIKENLLSTSNIDSNYDTNNTDLLCHEDNSPSGIITSDDQLYWAKTKPRPPRSIISKEAGRIVIRPDHFCAITFSWIGKRNHKFFILFNFYSSLFCILLLTYSLRLIIGQIRNNGWCWKFHFLFAFITVLTALDFGGMSLLFWIVSCSYGCKGITMHEEMMKVERKKFDKGCCRNLEDIFGPCIQLPCWLCPTNPWRKKTNEELVKNYDSYYDDALFTNPN